MTVPREGRPRAQVRSRTLGVKENAGKASLDRATEGGGIRVKEQVGTLPEGAMTAEGGLSARTTAARNAAAAGTSYKL